MFGMGFGEILLIAVVAIVFLGPDKLPKAMVDVAKFFKSVKRTLSEAKDMVDREAHLNDIKEQALEYKSTFESAANSMSDDFSLDSLESSEKPKKSEKETKTSAETKTETKNVEKPKESDA